jgi:hypothetical protein
MLKITIDTPPDCALSTAEYERIYASLNGKPS